MRKGSVRAALLLGSALGMAWQVPVVAAQEMAQVQPARPQFEIPAQPLTAALDAFARQSGWQVGYPAALAQGKTSTALRGGFTPAEALGRLLGGTGLTYGLTGANTVTLVEAPQGGNAAVLPAMTVEGQRGLPEIAWGPVDGYVATRSATGTKTDTPIIETPQTIAVITQDEMVARGVRNVTDAVRYTAGVTVDQYGADTRGMDWITIRGFSGMGNFEYQDGLRMLSIGNFGFFKTETYGLERLDVIKGPASVLYGQNSPGGMVQRISKRPTPYAINEVELQVGQYDHFQGAFDFSNALDAQGKLQARLTGLVRDADTELKYGNGDRVPDDRLFIAPSFTWQPTSDTKLTLLTSAIRDETENYFTYTSAGRPTRTAIGDPKYNDYRHDQWSLGYEFEHRFESDAIVRQNLRYGRTDLDYRALQAGTLQGDGRTLTRNKRWYQESMEALTLDNQLELQGQTGPLAHKLLVGVDHQKLNDDYKQNRDAAPSLDILAPVYGISMSDPTTTVTSEKTTLNQTGVYAQDQIKYDQRWVLTLGVRRDRAEGETGDRLAGTTVKRDDAATTWRAGLTHLFDNGVAPYASYAESFQPTTGTDIAGRPFVPTTAKQYEVGVKYQPPGMKGLITGSLYELTQENVLTTNPVNSDYNVQTGEIQSRGFELEGKASLALGLDLIASYTYQDVEVTKSNSTDLGKRPIIMPEHLASAWLDYTFQNQALAGFGLGGGARYVGSSYGNATNTIGNPAYTLFDAAVHYELAGLRFAINANNLFDKDYVSSCSFGNCYWGWGRSVVASAKYRW